MTTKIDIVTAAERGHMDVVGTAVVHAALATVVEENRWPTPTPILAAEEPSQATRTPASTASMRVPA